MKLEAVKIDKKVATAVLEEYAPVKPEERTKHDKGMLSLADAVLSDRKIIDIFNVLRAGGCDKQWRPRLALAPAMGCDRITCGPGWFTDGGKWTFQFESLLGVAEPRFRGSGTTVVPIVPPRARKGDLKDCLTLFEATWEDVPADPALLKPLGGRYYEVLSEWDLTELERAILGEHGQSRRGVNEARNAFENFRVTSPTLGGLGASTMTISGMMPQTVGWMDTAGRFI